MDDEFYRGGIYKHSYYESDKRFYGIKEWHDGYYQLFMVEEVGSETKAEYIIFPGVLIRQNRSLLGLVYYEETRSIAINWFYLNIDESTLSVREVDQFPLSRFLSFEEVINNDVEKLIMRMEFSSHA